MLPYEDVKRGDIIVFRHPTLITVDYVKRCIGLPGDHLKMVDKQVFINGQPLNEPYVIHQDNSLLYRDNFPLGEPEYVQDPKMAAARLQNAARRRCEWRTGDPARHSISRWATTATIRSTAATGAWCRATISWANRCSSFGPTMRTTEDLENYNLHHMFDLATHFFSKTRWNRTFKLIHGYHDYPKS